MRTLEFTRSAIWPLILACSVGIGFPAAADPPPVKSAGSNAAPSPASPNGVGSQFELSYWNSVSASEDRHQLEAYLAQYPNGTFSGLALAKIAALDRRGASSATQDSSLAPAVAPALAAAAPSPPESGDADPPAATDLPVAAATASAPAPAPAPVPVLAAAAPSRPESAGANSPAATEVPVAVSAPAPGPSTLPPSLAEQLRALGQSQGLGPKAAPPAPLDQCVKSS